MSGPRPDWQLRPHGKRHYRRGEKPCEACRQAQALRTAQWREAHPEYEAARHAARAGRYRAAREAGLGSRRASYAMRSQARLEQVLAGAS